MDCQDCVHYEVCNIFGYEVLGNFDICVHFKDKSKFIELPCKVGDKVWFIKFAFSYAKSPILAIVCGMKTFSNTGTFTFMALTDENNISRSFINQDIGKTVFLTKEEAEQALRSQQ